MVEVPEDLRKFNIRIVCCGSNKNTHKALVAEVVKEFLNDERS